MKRQNSFFASLLFAFAAVGLSAFAADPGGDVMRLTPIGYRLGATGGVKAYDPSVVTVTPSDTSIVISNKQVTLTADLNRDHKVICWQKFDIDPTERTEVDPIEEFGEKSETVSVDFNPNVEWMYVTVVVEYDPVRTVKASLSSFARGTVTVDPSKSSYQKGDVVTLAAQPEEGYAFVRWSDGNADHVRTLTVDGDIDLKAYIEPISSRVSFSAGAGAALGETSKRVSYDSVYGELPVPILTGAKFSGWTDVDGRTVTAKTTVSRVADHTLYAQWGADLYEIAWGFTGRGNGKVDGAGTYAYGSQPTLKAVPYEGSAFTGWTDGVTLNPRRITVLSNALYVAEFDVATYDVTFTYRDTSGNLVTTAPTTVEHGGKVDPPSIPEWPEHTFKNWSTEEYKKVTRNLAVEAIYDTMTYSVAFTYQDWQGNSVTTMPQHVTAGGKANPPSKDVVDNWAGHTFKGWDPDYNVIREDALCKALYDDVRCTVKFSYRDKDGNLVAENVTVNYGEAVLETSVPPKSKVDQWPDHEFLGWDERYAEATNCVTDDLTVNARYKDVIAVIYSPGKGQGDRQEFDLEEEGSHVILNPTNDLNYSLIGYTFDYWQSDDKTNYQPGDTVKLKAGDTLALTAQWAPITYMLKFDGNGGMCTLKPVTATYDKKTVIEYNKQGVRPQDVERANYRFLFWSRDPVETNEIYKTVSDYPYNDVLTVSNLTAIAGDVVTLYAIWKGEPQTVKINGQDVSIDYGSQLKEPKVDPETIPTGYAFSGNWTSNGVAVTFPITVTGSFDVEPVWKANEYTVVFNGMGSDGGTMEQQEFTYDVAQALTPNGFTRTGYTFANWTNEVGTIFADCARVKNLATNDGAIVELYATWTMNPRYYAVRFNANGGAGAPYVQDIECGVKTALTPNRFARTGYGFANWTNTTGSVYADGEMVTDLAAEGETNDLSAVWTANRFWVAFDANGGAGSMAAQAFTYDVVQPLTSNAFTKTGHAFAGWKTNETGAAVFADGAVVSNLTAVADATNTLWATWRVKSYEISFDSAGGSAVAPVTNEFGKAVSAPAEPTRAGYQFAGWYRGQARYEFGQPMPAENIALTAHWTANGYKVRFNPGEGTGEMSDQDFTYDEPKALEANRFTAPEMMVFDRWTNAVDSTTYADRETVCNLATGGVFVLYATWKDAPSYAVAFDGNGGEGDMSALRLECGKGGKLPANGFMRTGYVFDRWTNKVNGATFADGAPFTEDLAPTNGTATLNALWTPNRYWVKFDGNGATDGKMDNQEFTYDVAQALTANGFTRTGYGFAGWKTNETGSAVFADGAVVSNLTAKADATNALWATWTANHYTVRFNPNGGSGDVTTQGFTYDQSQKLADNAFDPPEPLKSFAGWATNETGKAVYANGAAVQNLTAEADGTVNLYAVWGDDSYTVIFDGNGATGGSMDPQVFKHGGTDTLTPNAYVRTGWGLKNWTNDSNKVYSDGASFTAPATGSGETLYAVWTNNIYDCTFVERSEDNQRRKYGEKLDPLPGNPSKTGYMFGGWTTNGSDVVNLSAFTMPDHDVVFTPLWTPIEYTIAFDGNGTTTVAMMPTNVKYNVEIALPSNTYAWAGHEFVHWTNSVGEVFENGKTVKNLATTDGATVTLYAVWKETGDLLRMALGLKPEFDGGKVSVSGGAWMIIEPAKEAKGVIRASTSADGQLRIAVPGSGTLSFTFEPLDDGANALKAEKEDGSWSKQWVDKIRYPISFDAAGAVIFSGTPWEGATWTLKNFEWTAK